MGLAAGSTDIDAYKPSLCCAVLQVGLVTQGQLFCVWANQACIRLLPTSCTPGSIVHIGEGTEVHVAPKPRVSDKPTATGSVQVPSAAPDKPTEAPRRTRPCVLRALMAPPALLLPLSQLLDTTRDTRSWLTLAALIHGPLKDSTDTVTCHVGTVRASSSRHKHACVTVLLVPSCLCPPGQVMLSPPLLQLIGCLPHSSVLVDQCIANRSDLAAQQVSQLGCPTALQLQPLRPQASEANTSQQPVGRDLLSGQGKAGAAEPLQAAVQLWWSAQLRAVQTISPSQLVLSTATHGSTWWAGVVMHLYQEGTGDCCFELQPHASDGVCVGSPRAVPWSQLAYPTAAQYQSCLLPHSTAITCQCPNDSLTHWRINTTHTDSALPEALHETVDTVLRLLAVNQPAASHGGHILLCGSAGSGKSQVVRRVCALVSAPQCPEWHVIHVGYVTHKNTHTHTHTHTHTCAILTFTMLAPQKACYLVLHPCACVCVSVCVCVCVQLPVPQVPGSGCIVVCGECVVRGTAYGPYTGGVAGTGHTGTRRTGTCVCVCVRLIDAQFPLPPPGMIV